MASTIASFDAFIKEYYTNQKVEDLTRAGKPFFGRIKKNGDISGDPWVVPILTQNPQGIAVNSLANAQTASGNVGSFKWAITMGNYFGTVSIGDKVILASRNNMGAFLEDKTTEIDGLYESFSNDMAINLTRNGGGASGQILSVVGNVITLTNPQDVFNFEVNEYVQCMTDDGTNTGTAPNANNTYVTARDGINGTITLNNAATITAAAGSYLFRLGNAVGNTGALMLHGVGAYITSGTPGTLWGVTRTTDVQRYSGCKVPANLLAGKGIEERIQLLGALMQGRYRAMTNGGNYECYMHPEDWYSLSISVQNRGIRPLEENDTRFGYEYIDVFCGGKRMKTFSDPYFPKGSAYILKMDNWTLGSYGELVTPVNGDGLQMLRAATTNDYEFRLKSYPEVCCNAPGFSGVVPLAA